MIIDDSNSISQSINQMRGKENQIREPETKVLNESGCEHCKAQS